MTMTMTIPADAGETPFAFNARLDAALSRAETIAEHHREVYAAADRAYFGALERIERDGERTPLPAPTGDQLERHAGRFGADGLQETAELFGASVCVDAPHPERRRGAPSLRAQVLDLHARGVRAATIADTLDVADRRVHKILAAAPQAA